MSSGRNRDDCPDCGYRKPDHTAGCVFGAALREGAAQARRRGMSPQMRALRGVVAEQFRVPLALDGPGLADLVDRIAAAVAEAMEQGIGLVNRNAPEPGTVDGIRPHRPVTPEQDARMKRAAEQWDKDNRMTPERAAATLAGRQSPTSCLRCGQPWIDATVRHLPDCPELDREAEHWSAAPEMEAAARDGWESHGPQGIAVAAGCPGCGAVPEQTKHGRVTLHAQACPRAVPRVPGPPTVSGPQDPVPMVQDPLSQLTCPVRYCGTDGGPSSHRATLHDPHMWGQNQNAYRCPGADVPGPPTTSGPLRTPGRYGECPQTERHAAHQWTGGVGDEVRYLCDGEPSADGS